MGLGLHGGGLEVARFLASRGADCLVTDLRDESTLRPSLDQLAGLPLRFTLGRHELDDFRRADFVVKNPAVRPDSPYLAAAKKIETDISLFLASCPAKIIAVTGSKGKSTTVSFLGWALKRLGRRVFVGGNITVSPLSFLDHVNAADDVVLELSSWQLGDLRQRARDNGEALLKPRIAILTTILPDHLDRYKTMEAYVADKRVIYGGQDRQDLTICADDEWGRSFASETRARVAFYSDKRQDYNKLSGWLTAGDKASITGLARTEGGDEIELIPAKTLVPGLHQKRNFLAAGLALLDLGFDGKAIREAAANFPGLEHRLEFFLETKGVRCYNDSAATIPEAAEAAVASFDQAPILITGGTDKALDFKPLARAAASAKAVVLLAGSGSDKLTALLDSNGVAYHGPYQDLEAAAAKAFSLAQAGDAVVLSPGCASFGMFLNEFDRGRRWKACAEKLALKNSEGESSERPAK